MPLIINGPGVGLPSPQSLYPPFPGNTPYTAATNAFSLVAGASVVIPAGRWICAATGIISAIQWLNPVTRQWQNLTGPGAAFQQRITSDGFNWRVINLSAGAYAATVTGAGSGYASATTTVTAGTGSSTWVPVVGGALGTFTVTAGGAGYTLPPNVFIPAPPYPGVAATATAALSGGAVNAITIRTAGAGYLVAPPVVIVPNVFDPAYINGTITSNATATVALAGAGTLTAVLLTNFGVNLASAPTLTVSGAGSSATAETVPASGGWVAAANDVITLQPDIGPY